jgi:hypothetical protein
MKHLEDIELVDWLDGVLPDARREHGESCAECRRRLSALQSTVARAAAVNLPEPSPLFWDHFSARVHEAVALEPSPRRWFAWPGRAAAMWATSAASAVILLFGMFWSATLPGIRERNPVAVNETAAEENTLPPSLGEMGTDEEWALVRGAAEGLQWDDAPAAGLTARPGSAERVALELSAAERSELVRLLQTELNNRSGA